MKFKTAIFSFVLALLLAGSAYLYLNMGGIAKSVTEKIGTQTLGVPVTLSSVDIDLKNRIVTARGLKIRNPRGYNASHAMTVDTIMIALDTLGTDPLGFNAITTTGAHIYIEATAQGATNLSDIRKNINSRASAGKDAPEESRITIAIKNLRIDDVTIHPGGILTQANTGIITMPDIHMQNIGTQNQGVLISEAMALVFDEVIKQSTRTAIRQGFMKGLNEQALRDIQDSSGLTTGILDQIQTETENMGAKLRGMFQ